MRKKQKQKKKQKKGVQINSFIEFDKPNEIQQYPHFRKYLKSNHPAMIVGEFSEQEWKYKKVMHGERDGRHLNDTIEPNPNPLDPEPMRVAKRVRHDKKVNFSKWRYRWKIRK